MKDVSQVDLRRVITAVLTTHEIEDFNLVLELTTAVFKLYHPDKKRSMLEIQQGVINAYRKSQEGASVREMISAVLNSTLGLNPWDTEGQDFVEFAYLRFKHGEDINVFAKWWLENGGEPKYWSFKRMRQLWFQAFRVQRGATPKTNTNNKWDGDYVPAPPPEERSV